MPRSTRFWSLSLSHLVHILSLSFCSSSVFDKNAYTKWTENGFGYVSSKIDILDAGILGKGVFAMADIPVSTRLLEVYPLLLETELRMHSTEKSCELDFDTVQLTERLLYLNKSYQNPKVDRIPGYDAWLESLPLTNVFDWSDEELKYLRFKDKRSKLKNRIAAVLKKFTTWTETKRGKESSESYERAMSVILSRAFDTSSRRYIFPYMSFFNHAPANSRENNALYSFGNGKMLVKAAKPIRKGTQLFIDYGPHLSSEAFLYQVSCC